MFVYHYKKFIHFIVVIGVLSYSYFGYANVTVESADSSAEASVQSSSDNQPETGSQVQEMTTNVTTSDAFQMPDYRFEFTGLFGLVDINNGHQNLGLNVNLIGDILYRIHQYDRWNNSLGLRYRVNFGHPNKRSAMSTIRFHELSFLIQSLIFIEEKFFSMKIKSFLGPVLGIHIWKSFRINYMNNADNREDIDYQQKSEFFWNYFSYQLGVKSGVILSSHFAVTVEIGFDQLGFSNYKQKINRNAEGMINSKYLFNNIYFTAGISYFL